MNFGEFKVILKSVNRGGMSIPDDISVITRTALEKVALRAKPLSLITNDVTFEPLVYLGDKDFIRKPNMPKEDHDDIDIENDLILAVAHTIWGYIEHNNRQQHEFNAQNVIEDYQWRVYETSMCH